MKYVHERERIGCRIYKYFIYSLGWFSFLTPFVLSGILIAPESGPWPGLLVAALFAVAYLSLGDRLILSKLEAQDLSRNRLLKNKRNNFCYLLGLGDTELYESFVLGKDVMALAGSGQRRIVLIGSELLKTLSHKEIDSLLLAALCEFQSKAPESRRLSAMFYLPYVLVLAVSQKLFGSSFITSLLGFLFYPSSLIHEALQAFIKSRSFYDLGSLEGVIETNHVQPTLYHLRLLQSSVVNRNDFERYLKSFSLAYEENQENFLRSEAAGSYGRQR